MTLSCIHCSMTFEPAKQNGAVIIGQSETQKQLQQIQQATAHLESVHPEEFRDQALLVGQMGWLSLMAHLRTDAPGFAEDFQRVSGNICRAVMRHCSDEDIDKFVGKQKLLSAGNVRHNMRKLRDYLCYADLQPREFPELGPPPTETKPS